MFGKPPIIGIGVIMRVAIINLLTTQPSNYTDLFVCHNVITLYCFVAQM